ncbi:hypothetical protein CHS60_25045 [Salmonella enterica]|nr:hypothetical protein [Salmonella enterica]EBF8024658.1 hypothetical protein [Salmonella enterica]ECX7881409.1 hypothetical protein [Salmonella enterica]PLM02204.1 hypothetical protein CWN68_00010 [Klebsiella michiganensis]
MGSCAAPSAKGDDKFITTDYLQQCLFENRNALIPVPRRLPWRACHKPTFSRRRKPHAPPFDPLRRRARKPAGVAGHQG